MRHAESKKRDTTRSRVITIRSRVITNNKSDLIIDVLISDTVTETAG